MANRIKIYTRRDLLPIDSVLSVCKWFSDNFEQAAADDDCKGCAATLAELRNAAGGAKTPDDPLDRYSLWMSPLGYLTEGAKAVLSIILLGKQEKSVAVNLNVCKAGELLMAFIALEKYPCVSGFLDYIQQMPDIDDLPEIEINDNVLTKSIANLYAEIEAERAKEKAPRSPQILMQLPLPRESEMRITGRSLTREQLIELVSRTDCIHDEYDNIFSEISHSLVELEYLYCDLFGTKGAVGGWVHPDGIIRHRRNISKDVKIQTIFDEWRVLAETFPFLNVNVTLFNDARGSRQQVVHRAGRCMGDYATLEFAPVVSMAVRDGRVELVDPLCEEVHALDKDAKSVIESVDDLYSTDHEHFSVEVVRNWMLTHSPEELSAKSDSKLLNMFS